MDSSEKFSYVVDVCVSAYYSNPKQDEVKTMFGNFKELARALFELTKYMKIQDKRKVDDFVDLLIDLLVRHEKVFPNKPCHNKLHFFMWHLVPFVARWETV